MKWLSASLFIEFRVFLLFLNGGSFRLKNYCSVVSAPSKWALLDNFLTLFRSWDICCSVNLGIWTSGWCVSNWGFSDPFFSVAVWRRSNRWDHLGIIWITLGIGDIRSAQSKGSSTTSFFWLFQWNHLVTNLITLGICGVHLGRSFMLKSCCSVVSASSK